MPDGQRKPMEPRQPWGQDGPTILVGERDPVTGYVPVVLPKPKGWSNPNFLSDIVAEEEARRRGRDRS